MVLFKVNSKLKEIAVKYIQFCIVGGIGVFINLGITYFLTEYLHIWYMISNFAGILVAVTSNFIGNYFWTFKR